MLSNLHSRLNLTAATPAAALRTPILPRSAPAGRGRLVVYAFDHHEIAPDDLSILIEGDTNRVSVSPPVQHGPPKGPLRFLFGQRGAWNTPFLAQKAPWSSGRYASNPPCPGVVISGLQTQDRLHFFLRHSESDLTESARSDRVWRPQGPNHAPNACNQ